MDEIKRKTSKLRNQGSIALDENFENFDDLVLSTIQGEVPNSKIKMLQIKFTEAIDSYILVSTARWHNFETLPQTDGFHRAAVESSYIVQSVHPIAHWKAE